MLNLDWHLHATVIGFKIIFLLPGGAGHRALNLLFISLLWISESWMVALLQHWFHYIHQSFNTWETVFLTNWWQGVSCFRWDRLTPMYWYSRNVFQFVKDASRCTDSDSSSLSLSQDKLIRHFDLVRMCAVNGWFWHFNVFCRWFNWSLKSLLHLLSCTRMHMDPFSLLYCMFPQDVHSTHTDGDLTCE